MQKLLVLIGISGSGKSTYAKELCNSDKSYVRINRDSIREMLVGYQNFYKRDDVKQMETLVQKIIEHCVTSALSSGKNVVLDETNLNYNPANFDKIADNCQIEYQLFEVNPDVAKNRVYRRDFAEYVEEDEQQWIDYSNEPEVAYIDKQHERFENLKLRLR